MISVVVWLWQSSLRDFEPNHVNTEQKMFAKHFGAQHRFICIADDSRGLSRGVEFFPTPEAAKEAGKLLTPEGERFPSCYRRLWTFSADARALGDVVLLLDIDLVLVRPINDLIDHLEEFIGWRPMARWGAHDRLAGGMYALRTGTRTRVWDDFHGEESITQASRAGYRGSDQAWISYKLGRDAAVWPERSGLYSIRDLRSGRAPLPADARLVQFNGPIKPWDSELPWVRKHWGRSDAQAALTKVR